MTDENELGYSASGHRRIPVAIPKATLTIEDAQAAQDFLTKRMKPRYDDLGNRIVPVLLYEEYSGIVIRPNPKYGEGTTRKPKHTKSETEDQP